MDEKDKKVNLKVKNRIERLSNPKLKEDLLTLIKILRIGYGIKPVRPRTIEGYVNALIQLSKFKPNQKFLDYDKKDLLEYFSSIDEKGISKNSLNLYKIKIKKYFTWLYRENNLCGREEIPEIVSWIKISKQIRKTKYIETSFLTGRFKKGINEKLENHSEQIKKTLSL